MIKKRILSLWISLCVICIASTQEKELAYCNRQIHKTLKAIGTSSKNFRELLKPASHRGIW